MGAIEALIDAIPGVEFVGEMVLLGTMLGTLAALRADRLGFQLKGWVIIGRWGVAFAILGLVIQVLSEAAWI